MALRELTLIVPAAELWYAGVASGVWVDPGIVGTRIPQYVAEGSLGLTVRTLGGKGLAAPRANLFLPDPRVERLRG